ncbi:hypothetical protein D3C75_1015910 [compost metagenome]
MPGVIGKRVAALQNQRLAGIAFHHVDAPGLKEAADTLHRRLVQDQLSGEIPPQHILGQIVLCGSQAACADHQIRPLRGNIQGLN